MSKISNGLSRETTMDEIVSLTKRRGFVFQGSEIYGGLAGTWDYGHYGVALKENIKKLWWDMFVQKMPNMYGLDSAILMNEQVWMASGHTGAGFTDPLLECEKCKKRFRRDHLEDIEKCLECGGTLGGERDFNLMFETVVGAQGGVRSYLRPETAQGIFVNFKNIIDTMRPKLPFGIAQIGKAFRNEIAPRDFIFRSREFEQMEIEYFVEENTWEQEYEMWRGLVWEFLTRLGLKKDNIHELEVPKEDRAHYSKRTIDFEYDYPHKRDELFGLAYRADFDLMNHIKGSGEKLVYRDADGKEIVPHVIEPTFGVDRAVMAVLCDAYTVDEADGKTRTVLKFSRELAPVKVAVFPLLKNKPELVVKARLVFDMLRTEMACEFDDNGNVGKRYRRQDEIGTPWCVTVDFDTLEDDTVTLRDRDSGEQQRVTIADLPSRLV